jgi:hypothetical protein
MMKTIEKMSNNTQYQMRKRQVRPDRDLWEKKEDEEERKRANKKGRQKTHNDRKNQKPEKGKQGEQDILSDRRVGPKRQEEEKVQ